MATPSPNGRFPSARSGVNLGAPIAPPREPRTPLLSTLDGAISSTAAAAQEIRNAARDIALAAGQQARMTSQGTSDQKDILRLFTETVRNQSDSGVIGSMGLPLLRMPEGPLAPPMQPFDAPHLSDPNGPSAGRPATPDRPDGDRPTQGVPAPAPKPKAPEVSNWDRLQTGRGYSIAQLREDTSRSIGSKVSGFSIGPSIRQAEGSGSGWEVFNPETGLSMGDASAAQIRNSRIANRVRKVGGSVAEDGLAKGLFNALPKGLAGGAAVVTGGLAVANQGAKIAEDQRRENAFYQRALGGSNFDAFGERARQSMFSLQNRGVLGSQDSQQLYKSVTQLGMTGDDRQDALEFALENYKKFGMEIRDSMKLIETSSANGVKSLASVSRSLEGVTESAREAGISAEEARERFERGYENLAPLIFGGSSNAAQVTGAIGEAQAGLGAMFKDIDLSSVLSENNLDRISAGQGISAGQFLSQISDPEGGAEFAVKAVEDVLMQIANNLLGPPVLEMIKNYKAEISSDGELTPEQAVDLSSRVLMRGYPHPRSITNALRDIGIANVDANNGTALLLTVMDRGFSPSAELEEIRSRDSAVDMSQFDMTNLRGDDVDGVSTWGEIVESVGGNFASIQDLSVDENGMPNYSGENVFTSTGDAAADDYLAGVRDGRYKYSPIVAKMLKESGRKTRVQINTGTELDPQMQDMKMEDIFSNPEYIDQLARGNSLITGGDGTDSTVADFTGITGQRAGESILLGDVVSSTGGQPGSTWGSEISGLADAILQMSRQQATGMEIKITPSGDLARYFQMAISDRASDAPQSSQANPQSLPSGNG